MPASGSIRLLLASSLTRQAAIASVGCEGLQFRDTVPSTHFEDIGSHEIGVSKSGKFTASAREVDRLWAKLGITMPGYSAEANLESTQEKSTSLEVSRERKCE
jgi:hypothetical protein